MVGEEVVLTDMLQCREDRVLRQQSFLSETDCPLLSFSMNIPGPVKTNEEIRRVFFSGKEAVLDALQREGLSIRKEFETHVKTGDELLYAIDGEAEKLKDLTVEIEEKHPMGRLFDMDIIGKNGEKLSRARQRRCLICGGPAQDCAHSRRHSVSEMQERIQEMMNSFLKIE